MRASIDAMRSKSAAVDSVAAAGGGGLGELDCRAGDAAAAADAFSTAAPPPSLPTPNARRAAGNRARSRHSSSSMSPVDRAVPSKGYGIHSSPWRAGMKRGCARRARGEMSRTRACSAHARAHEY